MAELADIFNFLEDNSGVTGVSENDDITYDLGIDGDDFDDTVIAFGKKFKVDVSSCLWYFHSSEEGNIHSIGGSFFRPPNERVKHIPVTPLMLLGFVNSGKWDIPYPEHRLPKKRYDLVINASFFILTLAFILYKCNS